MMGGSMKSQPLDIVGSSKFGRYPKISVERTYNMIISDGWLVPFAGHKKINTLNLGQQGRGIYTSTKFQHMILVVDNGVYIVTNDLQILKVNTIDTYSGDVFIAENNGDEIAICDKQDVYIFNYRNDTFQKINIDTNVVPGYITFQDTYFIVPDTFSGKWRLSANNDGTTWPTENIAEFQTKADKAVATLRMPGRGGTLLVFGSTVTEVWTDVGAQIFPYKRNTSYNIDYGCLNPATIASLQDFVVWLGANETSGPSIMYSNGGNIEQLSTDGINFLLDSLTNAANSYGFLFRQDGHLIYQITFPDDNLTLIYDFETKQFFHLCDERFSNHVAKRVVYFNNSHYFVSLNDGNLYELNSKYDTFDGETIPRVRTCRNFRMQDSSKFIVSNLNFTLEQGHDSSLSKVELMISKDGGEAFSSGLNKDLNSIGKRLNKLDYWDLGYANDFVPQFRFWGNGRFVVTNGEINYYQ